MKVVRDEFALTKFKDIEVGEVFSIVGNNFIYMKTSYVQTFGDLNSVSSNCVNLESGFNFKCDENSDVYPIKAKIVVERE